MRRIAFVASIFGHFRAFHLPYMKWFLNQGWEVYAFAKPDGREEVLQELNITCIPIDIERSPLNLSNIRAYRQLRKGFRTHKFDLVHVHTPVASVMGRLAAKRERVPSVLYTAHGFHFFSGAPIANWLLYYPLERLLAKKTDFLITINQEDYQRTRRNFHVREEVILVQGVGVEFPQVENLSAVHVRERVRKSLLINPDAFVFISIAELNVNKNHAQILSALHQLKEEGRLGQVRCLFVGRGVNEEEVQQAILNLGLQSTVQMLGYRNDVSELLFASDAVILTSRREGLPRALLEAMAAGKPIIATNTRGSRDLVAAGENGWLVPIDDITETASAMLDLSNNPARAAKMGQVSRERVEPYRIERVLKQMSEIYRRAIQHANQERGEQRGQETF